MTLQMEIQSALDDLSSLRSSANCQDKALTTLERLFAGIILTEGIETQGRLEHFVQLQDSFQCNVPSRILAWLSFQILHLNKGVEFGNPKNDDKADVQSIISHITLSLSLVQGVALIHTPSKIFLGSRYSIEVLLDLLRISRNMSSKPFANSTNAMSGHRYPQQQRDLPLASAVLDTFLCILVDSPPATRVFEEANGVEVVVKLLKKAGISRDVRMKCLEFLYFYLMDENLPSPDRSCFQKTCSPAPITRPTSPIKQRTSQPHSKIPPDSTSASSSFLSTTSSDGSFILSSSSLSPTPTLALSSPPSSPAKPSYPRLQPRSLTMLQKEVDFVPLSPKKAHASQLGVGRGSPRVIPIKLPGMGGQSVERTASEETSYWDEETDKSELFHNLERVRSTDEKKEILGQLLGNVDALVEGVKKAGIWGLG